MICDQCEAPLKPHEQHCCDKCLQWIDPETYMEELLTPAEREILSAIELAQGYWTQAARLIGEAYGATAELEVRKLILTGSVHREAFLDRAQARINLKGAA